MRVLLTGHKGYIGAIATRMLLAAGHEVTGIDTGFFADCVFGPRPKAIPEQIKDIRDLELQDLAGFDAVIHLAALSNDPLGNVNPGLTYQINREASVDLARLAKEAGVPRFVFSSSCSTYGASGDEFLNESAALNPVTAYAESKVMVEQEVSQLADENFSPTFMRNATAYGVSPYLRLDVVLNNFVAAAVATGEIYVKSDGTPWRPIVHIEDIVGAMIAVLGAPREAIHNQVFNVGATEENYRVSELADIVAETVPGARITYAPDGAPDKRCYRVDFAKIRQVLPGFQTKWTAQRGAQQLYEAFLQHGMPAHELEGRRFNRIAHIRQMLDEGNLDNNLRWQLAAVVGA